ncbi:MAG: tyrosine--tRNA ligase [candidate division WOR-3 bacterium]
MDLSETLNLLKQRTDQIVTETELLQKLQTAQREKRPLKVKLGIDASGPDIHLGFAVVLRKLRQFQDLGHTAVLIVGDFTGKIGDPTGRSKTRPQLNDEQIKKNIEHYKEQIFKILIPERTEFRYNSEWSNALTSQDLINIAAKYTVARIIERDDFASRLKQGIPIYLHEILYPLFQGYDSVAVKADIELGGADQYWNLLVGRELQREFGQEPQVIITMPLLEGTDGKLKMSKSYNNYIGIAEPPNEIYGKTMSIPDTMILKYFQLATDYTDSEIRAIEKRLAEGENPKNLKSLLAKEIVKMYHSAEAAELAEKEFEKVFRHKLVPSEIPEFVLKEPKINIVELLVRAKLFASKSEARRKINEGAVYLNETRITDKDLEIIVDEPVVIKAGKRKFLKVIPA